MDLAGIAALIMAISALITTIRNERKRTAQDTERDKHDERVRRELVRLGENFAASNADNMIISEAFNAMWLEFYNVTGKRPAANLSMLNKLTTLRQSETGRLGPLDETTIEAIRRAK